MLNIITGLFNAGSHRNIRVSYGTKNVRNHANCFKVFIYGLIADSRDVVGFENHVAVRTDVYYTADSLQAGAIPSPR
jgi:hypothetical protein